MPEIASNPFTPKSGWEPKVFVGREKEIDFFRKKLEEAKKGRCDHFLVLGDWGIGKTSLLKEFKRIAQGENILATFASIREFKENETLNDGVEHLIEGLPEQLPIKLDRLKNFLEQIESIGVQVLGTGFQFSRATQGMDPQFFLQNMLHTFWKDLEDETKALVILLDDVQNFSKISEIFTILKNVLSSEKLLETRILVVLSCTSSGWKQFLQLHHPIGRYFTPRITLGRLSKEKTIDAINKTLHTTGISFDIKIIKKIFEFTEGHPYELQVLCSKLYDNQIKREVTEKVWEPSLNSSLKTLGEDILDHLYENASEQEKKVLYIVARLGKSTRKGVLDMIDKYNLEVTETSASSALVRLVGKKLLIKPEKFTYSLPDRLFKEYILKIRGYDGNGTPL